MMNSVFNNNKVMAGAGVLMALGIALIAGGAYGHHFSVVEAGIGFTLGSLTFFALKAINTGYNINKGKKLKAAQHQSAPQRASGTHNAYSVTHLQDGMDFEGWKKTASRFEKMVVGE